MSKRYPFAVIKEKLHAKRDTVLDFAIGRRPVALPKPIEEYVRANAELALVPANRDDADAFRAAAADYLAREYGVTLPAHCILPTPGGRAAMTALIAAALGPGDKVAVTTPGYPAFARLAGHGHADILEMPLDPERNFAPDVSAALAFRESPVRIVSINYPNNPTGATLSSEVVAALCTLCAHGSIVFNDATYGPLVYDETPRSLLAEAPLQMPGVELVELHSFSKLFPLGPLAVSFLAGTEPLMESISTYSEFAWTPLSRLQLEITALGMRDEGRSEDLRRYFPDRIRDLSAALAALGFEPRPTRAGVYVLCAVPKSIDGLATVSAADAAERLIDEFDLAVVPLDTPQGTYLRFSALYQPADLQGLAGLQGKLQLA